MFRNWIQIGMVASVVLAAANGQGSQKVIPYRLASGLHAGDGLDKRDAYNEMVTVPGAASLRVVIEDFQLGAGSEVVIRSLQDDAQQHFNAETLAAWKDGSAYFNGDAVEVTLRVAADDRDAFVNVAGAIVEEFGVSNAEPGVVFSICGSADNRVASSDPRIARLGGGSPNGSDGGGGCTAWLLSNGAFLAAGHCGPGNNALVEFNVPTSNADGSLVRSDPADQYRAIGGSVINANNGLGDDWTVFDCSPNTETGLTAVIAQNGFYRGSIDGLTPTNIRITGYGYDDSPPGSANWNSSHKIQQTHFGEYVEFVDDADDDRYHRYIVDTRAANSGSPIAIDGTTMSMGIHTHAGCNADVPESGANRGTSFTNVDLRNAVEDFRGTATRFADVGHTSNFETGTVFRPYATVASAFANTPNNGTVFIVRGNYTAANGNDVIYSGKNAMLTAPVGSVVIGN